MWATLNKLVYISKTDFNVLKLTYSHYVALSSIPALRCQWLQQGRAPSRISAPSCPQSWNCRRWRRQTHLSRMTRRTARTQQETSSQWVLRAVTRTVFDIVGPFTPSEFLWNWTSGNHQRILLWMQFWNKNTDWETWYRYDLMFVLRRL